MTEWMKLYAVYSLSISPNYSHRTTLLNTKVLNLYITQVGVSKLGSTGIHLLSRMSKRMGHRLLSRQSSCTEATAIHILDIPGWVFVFRLDGAPAHRARDTVAFLERKGLDFIFFLLLVGHYVGFYTL